jgi:hypothetical protein
MKIVPAWAFDEVSCCPCGDSLLHQVRYGTTVAAVSRRTIDDGRPDGCLDLLNDSRILHAAVLVQGVRSVAPCRNGKTKKTQKIGCRKLVGRPMLARLWCMAVARPGVRWTRCRHDRLIGHNVCESHKQRARDGVALGGV